MGQFIADAPQTVVAAPLDQIMPVTAQLADGARLVVWEWGSSVMAQAYDALGNPVGGETTLFGSSLGGVAALADGTFVVATDSHQPVPDSQVFSTWNIWQQRVSASGQALGSPQLVATRSDLAAFQAGPVLAAPDGSYYVSEFQSPFPSPRYSVGTWLQRFDAAGAAIGTAFNVGGGTTFGDVAVLSNGNIMSAGTPLVIVYVPFISIVVKDGAGTTIAQSTVGNPYTYSGMDTQPQLEALAGGNALIVWRHDPSDGAPTVQAEVLDTLGQPVGAAHALDVPVDSTWKLVALADGGALVWWNVGSDFFAQDLDAGGNASGDAFALGANVSSVAATLDGGFVVEHVQWHDGTGLDVEEQRFAPVSTAAASDLHVSGGVTAIPAGNYVVIGSAGLDAVSFGGAHTQYAVLHQGTMVTGLQGTDVLQGIERVLFGDGFGVALDVDGHAGQAYRLYQAAFDRAPDLPGQAYQMHDLDLGNSLSWVAGNFIASPEFAATYGSAVSDAQFITLLYENVLHREPEAAGLQFHLDEFAQGQSRADMLTHFSESPENRANVIGQIEQGIAFTFA